MEVFKDIGICLFFCFTIWVPVACLCHGLAWLVDKLNQE